MKIKFIIICCFFYLLVFDLYTTDDLCNKLSKVSYENEGHFMHDPKKLDLELQVWESKAKQLPWFKIWDKTLIWNEPIAHWFAGGLINASYVCLDAHIKNGSGNQVAIFWESENGKKRTFTYEQLYQEVNKFASVLLTLGVKSGDLVIIYMPVIPETLIAMLALARIGATHAVVFSGFSALALKDRIEDTRAQYVITTSYGVRRGKKLYLKKTVDEAVKELKFVKKVLVIDRDLDRSSVTDQDRDILYQDLQSVDKVYVPPIQVESKHPLFILYTSGTTGKPKGLMHSTGGYLTHCYSSFDWAFKPIKNDIYWCTADYGWITGHSYVVYAPLMHGVTILLYEGTPDYPDFSTWWSLIEKYGVNIFYTSPTALRMAIKAGDEWPNRFNLKSLRVLGTVGEPINPEVWKWYHRVIGGSRCPIIDTWWQTETGGFMIAPSAQTDRDSLKPGSATKPLPGVFADVVDELGNPQPNNIKGYLVIKKPWPGMSIGIYNDQERFKQVYWTKFKNMYYTGDYAYKDDYGNFWLLGRADEVLSIAGHRIGTAEIESAAVSHIKVAEAAAVGIAEAIKGEQAVLFVTLKKGYDFDVSTASEIRETVRSHIGAFVTPANIYFVSKLPKTRSGKIMRRVLKGILEGKSLGDISTLEDEASLEEIQSQYNVLNRELNSAISG